MSSWHGGIGVEGYSTVWVEEGFKMAFEFLVAWLVSHVAVFDLPIPVNCIPYPSVII